MRRKKRYITIPYYKLEKVKKLIEKVQESNEERVEQRGLGLAPPYIQVSMEWVE